MKNRLLIFGFVICVLLSQIPLTQAIIDDSFEDNDSIGQAKLLSNGTSVNLIQSDKDYFLINSDRSGTLNVHVESQTTSLQLHILSIDGIELNGSTNKMNLQCGYFFPDAGNRIILVEGPNTGESYNITVDYIIGSFSDDTFEENDDILQAKPLNFGTLPQNMHLKQYDTDWYFFTSPNQGCALQINMYHTAPPYMLYIQVFTQNGNNIPQYITSTSDGTHITFFINNSVPYNLKVWGTNEGREYSLEIIENSSICNSNISSNEIINSTTSSSNSGSNNTTTFENPEFDIPGYPASILIGLSMLAVLIVSYRKEFSFRK
jgi:hypothetical protein